MRTLWVRMTEIYGARWGSGYDDSADSGAGETWAKGLAGITPAQLADGLKACIASTDPWPPTLPEFRARCLSIPSLARVRLELRDGTHSRFTRLVWQGIDGYRFRQAPSDQADRMLRDAYALACEDVMRGGALPPAPVGQLEAAAPQKPKSATSEQVRTHVARIRQVLGMPARGAASELDLNQPASERAA